MQTKSFSFEELFSSTYFLPYKRFKLLSMTIIKYLFKKKCSALYTAFL